MLKIKSKSKYIAIAILVGGKSTRFGSDKGLFKVSGKPLISYQLDTLIQLKHDIFVVTHSLNQTQNYMKTIDVEKIYAFIIDNKDLNYVKTTHTPMIGLYSTFEELKNLNYQKVLALSCDLPLIRKEVIEYLIEQSRGFDCCIPRWENGFIEPLMAIYPVNGALKMARKNLRNKTYKLTNLISSQWNTNYVSIEKKIQKLDKDLISFTNINEQSDLKNLEETIDKQSSKDLLDA
ncbi:MAG: molybdenum cofactor guanylyltransferase [Promethearchaeota archaeon]